jgi:5-formyltetrahydrofolate cyclo-ligase
VEEITASAKLALRDQILTGRRQLGLTVLGERARSMCAHLLAATEVRRAATVAVYASVSTEPGTGPLLDALRAAGKRVILPLVMPDFDLDWAEYDGPDGLMTARRGLLEPSGPALVVEAIATADAVLVPGLAVSRDGVRLGKGAGCYDRALRRVPVGTFTCVLLNSEEVLEQVPAAPHDRPVAAVATELGITRF